MRRAGEHVLGVGCAVGGLPQQGPAGCSRGLER
jgi:hypothetical protein